MASNALIQGARDIGRANVYDPYKFQAWIRSMFYGLDKLDDRMYAERMNGISQMAKIQKEAAKVRENIIKENKGKLDAFNVGKSNVTTAANPGQRPDIQPQLTALHGQYAYLTNANQNLDPLSEEYSNNDSQMKVILNKMTQWKGLLDNYQGYTGRLYQDMENDGDATLSNVHRYKYPMYQNLLNDNHHRVQFFTNDDGNEDMAIIFDNPYGEEIHHLGDPLFTENGKDTYGLVWSEFIASGKADYYLKNRGQDKQMTEAWDKLRVNVNRGNGNMFIPDPDRPGLITINTKENFTSKYPWEPIIRAPLTLEDGTVINEDADANLLSLIYDFDPDGVGGTATTFRETTEWMAIQDFYTTHYLPKQTDEYNNKVKRAENWGYGVPEWTLDPDFAFGEVDIPIDLAGARLSGPDPAKPKLGSFAGRDLASHAFNIYIGDATFTSLQPDAAKYILDENARRVVKMNNEERKRLNDLGNEGDDEGYSLTVQKNREFIGSVNKLLSSIQDSRKNTLAIDEKFIQGVRGSENRIQSEKLVLEENKNRAATLSNMTGRSIMTIEDAYAVANEDAIKERKKFDAESEELKQAVIDDAESSPPPVPPTLEEWIKENQSTSSKGGFVIRRKDKLGWENFDNKLFNEVWGAHADDGRKITEDQLVKLADYLQALKGFDAPIGHITGSENWKNFKTEFENWSKKYNQ